MSKDWLTLGPIVELHLMFGLLLSSAEIHNLTVSTIEIEILRRSWKWPEEVRRCLVATLAFGEQPGIQRCEVLARIIPRAKRHEQLVHNLVMMFRV